MCSVKIINHLIPFHIRPDLVIRKVSNPEFVFLVLKKNKNVSVSRYFIKQWWNLTRSVSLLM